MDLSSQHLTLVGGGKMGSALLAGWLANGLPAANVLVVEPNTTVHPVFSAMGVEVAAEMTHGSTDILVLAVKPQMIGNVAPLYRGKARNFALSIIAGTPVHALKSWLGADTTVLRSMPNTPAAVGAGITALCGDGTAEQLELAEALLKAVGEVVLLDSEEQMHAVTGLSGSGPAYVFYMIDCLAAAGVAQGLPPELAMKLAKQTVSGAGKLAKEAEDSPAQLRINVTSPKGTTEAGLGKLMDAQTGLMPLTERTVKAAADRSRELAQG